MIAINKTNPTTKRFTYLFYLLMLCLGSSSHAQLINEDFTGYANGNSAITTTFNGFQIIGGVSNTLSHPGGTAPSVQLFDFRNPSIEYIGSGTGKVGGVGTISFWVRLGNTTQSYEVQISYDGGVTYDPIGDEISDTSLGIGLSTWYNWTWTENDPRQNVLIRILRTSTGFGFLRIDDFSITNFSTPVSPVATWASGNWTWNDGTPSGTVPSLATHPAEVIINDDYDTELSGRDSFSGLELTVNSGYTLRVFNGDYVEIENDVTVETTAALNVETQGSFVQRGVGAAAGTFTLVGSGSSQVNKFTAPLTYWYNYTYWSSPVTNADVDTALSAANPNRRYWFDASTYLDTDGNDIDDDFSDWQPAAGTGAMEIGKGYAATHNNFSFSSGSQYQYIFVGALNTGDYDTPIHYNSSNLNDHWNLVGNPYPSAIKVLGTGGLIEANTGKIKPAVYLWSASNIEPSSANTGDAVLNFDNNDYAIINGTMPTAGGANIIPDNSIASGQSFFVSSLQTTNLVFNNDMRLSGTNSNDQFFRSSVTNENSSDSVEEARIWLNLITDSGIFSQLGVGYVANATDGYDGSGFDAKRNAASGSSATIYSQIEGEDHKLAIQGKSANSLDTEEIIKIGFFNAINQTLTYKFSLAQFEGTFLNDNPIYLKDNLLDNIHNLKDSDYSFTSGAGEFNERFEIVFSAESLSTDDNQIDENTLTITELDSGEVAFNVGKANTISNVTIYDMLGRQVYDLTGSSSREVYNLSNLGKAAYVAQVTLDNGQVIRKKAIKRN